MAKDGISRGHATTATPRLWRFRWQWIPGHEARGNTDLMAACAVLFNNHYGTWGPEGPRPGDRVRISPRAIAQSLQVDNSWLACAYAGEELVGFCSSVRVVVTGRGTVSWVTRLVVDEAYRGQRVATTLLYGTWQFSDFYAWGLATANPLAVRALETATRRPCRARVIAENAPALLADLASATYLPTQLVTTEAGSYRPKVLTDFHVDLSNMQDLRRRAARADRPWGLGNVDPGEEWFACTFQSQQPDSLDDERLKDLLLGADDIWVQAYENMSLDEEHRWHAHAEDEIEWAIGHARPPAGSRILDVGCGDGRHAAALAARGFEVIAIDISPNLIGRARAQHAETTTRFEAMDARRELPEGPFDLAIMLYDVLGSSANNDDDRDILRNLAKALEPGGLLIMSVMNSGVTAGRLADDQRPMDRQQFIAALEGLPPSQAMETSGDIFNPDLLLLHEGIYYRKEQFEGSAARLPTELIIRDRRFSVEEVDQLLDETGFKALDIAPVQAGRWSRRPPLDWDDTRAKELLIVARRAE